VSFEFNGYQRATSVSSISPTQVFLSQSSSLAPSAGYRWEQMRWEWFKEYDVTAVMEIDRLNVQIHAGPAEIAVGRQPINTSVTLLWSPNDLFQPFAAYSFNTVFKPGVDALKLDWAIGLTSGATLYGVLGYKVREDEPDEASWDESAVVGRAFTILGGFELALIGGKAARQYLVGGSFQGELGPLGVR